MRVPRCVYGHRFPGVLEGLLDPGPRSKARGEELLCMVGSLCRAIHRWTRNVAIANTVINRREFYSKGDFSSNKNEIM